MIDLVESDEQAALAAAAAELLDKISGSGAGADRAWSAAVGQGWLAIGVPEHLGGVGYGLAEQALLLRELGRHASPLPVLESALAVAAALPARSSDEGAHGVLADLIAGSARACLAQPGHPGQPDQLVVWERDDEADYALILTPDAVDLVPADALRPGTVHDTIDPLYRLRRASWNGAGSLAHGPAAAAAGLRDRALVLASALLSGIAAQARDASVGYAAQRVQYGRPIGAFQAVKHRCADMAVRAEAAWCMTALAALGVQHGTGDGRADAYAARLVAADAALRNARDNIQNHGAMGFTAELAAHRLLKRAHVLGAMLATAPEARSALLAADSS